jgi:hypothetical protein
MSSVDEMAVIEHAPKIRPGQVWLCVEHHEDPDADCSCGLTPYLPRSEVEALERQLAGAVEALEWIERFTSDRGDARMMEAGQARAHIHRRASAALGGQS